MSHSLQILENHTISHTFQFGCCYLNKTILNFHITTQGAVLTMLKFKFSAFCPACCNTFDKFAPIVSLIYGRAF